MDRYIKRYIMCVVLAAVYMVAAVIIAVVAYYFDLSDEFLAAASFVVMNVCMFASSVICAVKAESGVCFRALAGGMIFTGVILIASLVAGGGNVDFHKLAVRLPLYVLICVAGGVTGINLK